MKWRVIPLETVDAFQAMALDEACSESVKVGGPPTIRFWKWKPSAVSIGYFQSLKDEVRIDECERRGVNIVRRRTGGGAVYHDSEGEITYSITCPESLLPKGITESYHLICGWIVDGLKTLGIQSEFKPINDIITGGKKISGNAQTRRQGVLLQHGTILHDLDVETMFSLLKVTEAKISDKLIQSVKERVTRILDFKQVSQEETYQALLKGLTQGKEWEFGEWTSQERERASQLAKERYSTREWNWMK